MNRKAKQRALKVEIADCPNCNMQAERIAVKKHKNHIGYIGTDCKKCFYQQEAKLPNLNQITIWS